MCERSFLTLGVYWLFLLSAMLTQIFLVMSTSPPPPTKDTYKWAIDLGSLLYESGSQRTSTIINVGVRTLQEATHSLNKPNQINVEQCLVFTMCFNGSLDDALLCEALPLSILFVVLNALFQIKDKRVSILIISHSMLTLRVCFLYISVWHHNLLQVFHYVQHVCATSCSTMCIFSEKKKNVYFMAVSTSAACILLIDLFNLCPAFVALSCFNSPDFMYFNFSI